MLHDHIPPTLPAAALEGRREWGWRHPPQGSVEDNGEGQEDHGGSTASLGNACESPHGDLVQDRPLWATPAPGRISWRPGPQTRKGPGLCQAAPSQGRVGGLLPAAGRRRSGGHSGTQSSRLQAPWSSPQKTSLLLTMEGRGEGRKGAEGRKKGREGGREEGKETERREERAEALWVEPRPPREPTRSPPVLPREGPPGPTFSVIPEYTGEGHVLKPERGSQGRGRRRLGEERRDCGVQGRGQRAPGLSRCVR